MKKAIIITIAIMAGVLLVRAADLKTTYDTNCARCHGVDGKGDTKMGKKLGAKDYTDARVQQSLTDGAGFKAIKEGLKDKRGTVLMKKADGMSDTDIMGLVRYMRGFKK